MMQDGLTFDDILILPGYTNFKRQEVNLTTKLHDRIILKLPVISSPMDTVTEDVMALHLARVGGLGIIHRNLSIQAQAGMVESIKKEQLLVGAAVGIGSDFEERARSLMQVNTDVLVIDSGHGNTNFMVDAIHFIKNVSESSGDGGQYRNG